MTDLNSMYAGVISVLAILILTHIILKISHPIINSIKSALFGTAGIIILSASSVYTGINIPLNIISLGLAAILGIPGIGTIMILNTLLN